MVEDRLKGLRMSYMILLVSASYHEGSRNHGTASAGRHERRFLELELRNDSLVFWFHRRQCVLDLFVSYNRQDMESRL